MIEKLPGSVGDKAPPADVIVNIIAVLNNLVVESPMAARDIVYFDGLRKLFYIKKRRDRWELPLPAWTWGPVLLFPFFPCSSEVDEAHNQPPFPSLGVGNPQSSTECPRGWPPSLYSLLGTPHGGVARCCSHPARCGGPQPVVFCLFPPNPWPSWGGIRGLVGSTPCLVAPKNSSQPLSAPARTTRSHPERRPASWATCGSIPSSTGTSRWYVPPSCGVLGWSPREPGPGPSPWKTEPPRCIRAHRLLSLSAFAS